MATLQAYDWPGNVRELENAIERAVIFSNGNTLQLPNLPAPICSVQVTESACPDIPHSEGSLSEKLDALEEQLIHQALRDAQGIQAQAAELLGISRSNLQYKLKKYKLL
ncbi:MAG: helix-turn-helix domain-containing protein [Desulfuromonas sp.]|nr:helix-turn-helix domain-containing protein [Desulfuromonas sp.]